MKSIASLCLCLTAAFCAAPTNYAQAAAPNAMAIDGSWPAADVTYASTQQDSLVTPVGYYAAAGCSCGHGGQCDCLCCRESLTNGLWGYGYCLEDCGIGIKSSLTQFYQGPSSGGRQQSFSYGAKFDLYADFNTEKMGLWEGGDILVHASEWQFGENANADAVFASPVNANLLYPTNGPSYALSHLLLTQQLGDGHLAMVGRYSMLDLWEGFYPDYGHGLDGFMNVSMIIPLNIIVPTVAPISNMAGLVKAGERGLERGVIVTETTNHATDAGLDFNNGVTILGFDRLYTDFGGLAGSHTVAATYATGTFRDFNPNGWITGPAGLVQIPILGEQKGSWSAGYIAEQRLWQDPCNAQRYSKMMLTLGVADHDTSPYGFGANVSSEAFGLFACRPSDRMGIGYFYYDLTNGFQTAIQALGPAQNVQGGEIYYNAAITKWFHLTADAQAIQPIYKANDTAIVLGLRGRIDF
ncbi:carbohydrate porin [Blastopirellula sp. JC732]|uniref:Carbohydrate porin n=1 Tax=Blastopirellula sediminis TaxID=2894196 RepID=A0A9X1SGR2_9BACT|nr:carbohydrate porin [Blastopirellula sediminis]MCC9606242.1 carbohydrate porin [Blastopirellula sediminis]MCC9630460.1 carbohydrate porin [Blastopirellula sediminis]